MKPIHKKPADELPPHSPEAEAVCLGCVLYAGISNSQAEVDALLTQLRPGLFYVHKHKAVLALLAEMRGGEVPHAVDTVTVCQFAKDKGVLGEVGDYAGIVELLNACPTLASFSTYLDILKEKSLRRWCLAKSATLKDRALSSELSVAQLKDEFAEITEQAGRIGGAGKPMIEVWRVEDAQKYVPDPRTFLIGEDIVTRGETFVIAGPGGVGKSRLANTLAFAGARGNGLWMGYPVRRRFRTMILQSENGPNRIASEVQGLDSKLYNDFVRISLPCFMQFSLPAFRAELRRLYDSWPFDLIVIDNMNDVARADGREDFLEGLSNIQASLPTYPDTPAVCLLAHVRKMRGGDQWKPRTGSQLQDELSGSFVLAAKARTVFFLQRGEPEVESPVVVFDCGKCNNGKPVPIAAYNRCNVEFQPLPGWDLDAWLNPPDDARKVVSQPILSEVFDGGKVRLTLKRAAAALMERGFSQATAYRALDRQGKFAALLSEDAAGLIGYAP